MSYNLITWIDGCIYVYIHVSADAWILYKMDGQIYVHTYECVMNGCTYTGTI